MKRIVPLALALLLAAGALLAGCATGRSASAALYDLGPLPAQQSDALPALPPIAIADVQVPAWLDSTLFYYRLHYANERQPRAYAQARWTMTPAQLLQQRLKARIAQHGGVALAASHGALNVPILRIEADDFAHHFATPQQSSGHVALRASVFRGRTLLAHRNFRRQVPAPSADAEGGAQALASASDAAIADMIAWLGTLNLK